MSDHEPAHYQPSPQARRWPWIVAVVAAVLVGGLVGYASGLNVTKPDLAAQKPTATASSRQDPIPTPASTPTPTSTAAAEPAWTWPIPGSELADPLEARPPGTRPPPFPDAVEGYDLSREWRETVRAFSGTEWATIYEFPLTMNGCSLQRFYVRWRAVNEQSTVQTTFVSVDDIVLEGPVDGAAGWMSGYGCGQPAFRMKSSTDESTLTDVVVEVQQWNASV
ncbi:hypothetical protein [Actinophytocola xinjiangensis]|uniref:hypothetical protein n=1 Tax=Actinophytocola xinjiangensis TaxID=485602 RepID=UPI0012B712EB|nr:hypothetical protein [Actinophytocola xinjiangensis]